MRIRLLNIKTKPGRTGSSCIICMLALFALFSLPAAAQKDSIRHLDEFTVWASRPVKDIGVLKTPFDSTSLKENIALSMADVLTFNSSVFVKSYGRATLSTIAFRGTSPSHTQVTWNGLKINNPMLGMTDFSTIPSYFVDNAALLHGTSSVGETGGGLGGLVSLSTAPSAAPGFNMQYIQGVGSFSTFDEFGKFTYSNQRIKTATRIVYSSSPNDFKYRNHDKKQNIYDEDRNIIGQYYPVERNKSGAYKDFQVLQEVYYYLGDNDNLGLNAWFVNSNRELPLLTTDYGEERKFSNSQREATFRGVLSWNHYGSRWKSSARGGYVYTRNKYDYNRQVSDDVWAVMTRSRSNIHTIYGQINGDWFPSKKWYFSANVSLHQHFVRSEDKNVIVSQGDKAVVGYDKGRVEVSGSASVKWQPIEPLGLSAVVREEMFGTVWAPVIPAFFADVLICRDINLMARASVSRNYKFPTLNDLYFLPGGNPELKNEKGWSYDAGVSFNTSLGVSLPARIGGGVTWFESMIDDWIMWLPTTKGFYSPSNVKRVNSYGIESKINLSVMPWRDITLDINGSYSWTPSINKGDKLSEADKSVGKQLPYVPRHSASITGKLSWKSWSLLYKWVYYSKRYTMTSNDNTITGIMPDYYMSNVTVEKNFVFRSVDLQVKLAVNNLFNEDYMTVLSRPMPGINFEVFFSITPKF